MLAILSSDEEYALPVLCESKIFSIEKSPFDEIVCSGQGEQNCPEVLAMLHRQKSLHILKHEEVRLYSFEDFYDFRKERSPDPIMYAELLASGAKRLTRESGSQ